MTQVTEAPSIPTDEDLDALVVLVVQAGLGGCGVHPACRQVTVKRRRDAARRWFLGRAVNRDE